MSAIEGNSVFINPAADCFITPAVDCCNSAADRLIPYARLLGREACRPGVISRAVAETRRTTDHSDQVNPSGDSRAMSDLVASECRLRSWQRPGRSPTDDASASMTQDLSCGSHGLCDVLPHRWALSAAASTTHSRLRTASDQNTRLWLDDSRGCVHQFQVLNVSHSRLR